MGKQISFWLGFFASALVIIPSALFIWGAAEEYAREVAVFLFGATCVLVLLLVIVLFFRDRILRKLTGQTEVAATEVVSSLVSAVSAASAGNRAEAEAEAQKLIGRAVGAYAWSNFYRWVIGTALGLLLAFGAFVGTVMLFEQTRTLRLQTERLGEQTALMSAQTELMKSQTERLQEQTQAAALQNEIMMLGLGNALRTELIASSAPFAISRTGASLNRGPEATRLYYEPESQCALTYNPDAELFAAPRPSTREALAIRATAGMLADAVTQALGFLTFDSDSRVALGALLIRDGIVSIVERERFFFECFNLA